MFNRKNVVFSVLLIVSIFFLIGNNEQRIKKAQFIGNSLLLPFSSSITYIKNLSNVYQRNNYLQRELYLAQNELRMLKVEVSEFQRFEELIDNIEISNYEFLIADVVGTGSYLNYETLLVDAGKNRNVQQNQPVISEKGIVGKVIAVYQNYSVVQTFGNKYFRLGAIDSRSRIHGIVETDLNGRSYFEKIKVGSDLKTGDMIVSSKLSSVYPPELPFGKIVEIEQSSEGLFTRAEVEPFVNLANIEAVVIIQAYGQ
ncbi:MAG: rod shape-determining protein MreC [Candidatus Cloacimonetes bacterium]|nr:rod shape-determining protein MreC [Candidatus Cloacimonadota bacterium]